MFSTNITNHPTLAQKRRRPLRAAHVGACGLPGGLGWPIELRTTTKLSLIPTPAAIYNDRSQGTCHLASRHPRRAAFTLRVQLVRFLFFCLFSVADVSFLSCSRRWMGVRYKLRPFRVLDSPSLGGSS